MTQEGSFVEVEPKIEISAATPTPENYVENGIATTEETIVANSNEEKVGIWFGFICDLFLGFSLKRFSYNCH